MTSAPRPLGLAFVGCGAVTERHSRTLRAMGADVRLLYASRDASKADAFRRRFGGAGAFGSYAAAWEDPGVDAALVATPPHLHLEQTRAALGSGKHVILEKPAFPVAGPATDVAAGADVATGPDTLRAVFASVRAAAARAGRGVYVAENYVYKPLIAVLRETLRRGDIGEPLLLLIDAARERGGLLEGGIHWVSFMAALGLEPRRVTGHRAGRASSTEETVLAVFEYEGGAVGALSFSWEVPSPLKGLRLSRIYGREGTVRFESNGLFVWVRGRRTAFRLPGLRDLSGHRAMFTDFFDAIRTGREPLMTLDFAERDLRLVGDIYATMGKR
ncbi:MAG: Gfo/Idh/MocA family oxidoreductase [Gemmatimonadetes bacterium]|nr:Gfo/Idh/MocA family oxidoreductase [Gemmatimonadota bacterium]